MIERDRTFFSREQKSPNKKPNVLEYVFLHFQYDFISFGIFGGKNGISTHLVFFFGTSRFLFGHLQKSLVLLGHFGICYPLG